MRRDYKTILTQIRGLTTGEPDFIANLSNIAAVLKELPGYFWVGFYLVKGNELVLGPFQGPVACTRIGYGKGVCGVAWKENKIQIVPDVHEFEGHIACNAASRSELVIPVTDRNGSVILVLDIDSDKIADFDVSDAESLKELADIIGELEERKV